MLTLQLRSALQEAEMLETTDHTIDEDAARRQLRERLDPLLEDRRREYAAALEAARADAAAVVEQARAEAERQRATALLAAESARVAEAERLAEAARIAEEERIAAEECIVADETLEDWAVVEPVLVEPADVEPAVVEPADTEPAIPMSTVPATIARPAPQEVIVSIDADAFARVFATVFAALLEQRGYAPLGAAQQVGGPVQYPQPYPQHMTYAPAAPTTPPRQSFWSHALHPDVLLMGLATVIVLVVLAAWLV
jgi:hypothetical protein